MPFHELLLWIQLEIGRKNYKQAEWIFKKYISYTTNLIDDETKSSITVDFRKPSDSKDKDPWKPKPEILTLKECEFHKLMQIYVFEIVLPDRGFEYAKSILMRELPLATAVKTEMLDKL